MEFFRLVVLGCFFVGVHAAQVLPAAAQDTTQDPADTSSSEFSFDEEIDFDMGEFEGFDNGEFGAPEMSSDEEAAVVMIGTTLMLLGAVLALISLVLTAVAAYLLYDALIVLPEAHREISPVIPWLLLIPLVNLVILFVAFIKVPDSLRGYLEAHDDTTQGDCGKSLGIWGSVATVLGCLFPIGIVLLFMSLTKINQAKHKTKNLAAVSHDAV